MSTEYEVIDHSGTVLEATQEAIETALEAMGVTAEDYAKLLCPVDTGRLRNSITHAVSGKSAAISEYRSNSTHADTPVTQKNGTAGKPAPVVTGSYSGVAPSDGRSVFIGTNVEYAQAVETGDSGRTPQPFLRPAITNHKDEYVKILKNQLRNA